MNDSARPQGAADKVQKAMDDLDLLLSDYIHFTDQRERWATCLWAAYTYAYDLEDDDGPLFDIAPYLWVKSAGADSGKSTLAKALARVVRRADMSETSSASSLFRKLRESSFTPLLDEADNSVRTAVRSEDSGGRKLLAFLNSGTYRGGSIKLTNPKTYKPEEFPTFCPKAIIGIKVQMADTLASRCIHINMQRATKEEAGRLKRFRFRTAEPRFKPIREVFDEHIPNLDYAPLDDQGDPRLSFVQNRAEEMWEVMLALADAIGSHWPDRCLMAARYLSRGGRSLSLGEQLLRDLHRLFDGSGREFIPTAELLGSLPAEAPPDGSGLYGMADSPWAEYRSGEPITATRVAGLLLDYDVKHERRSVRRGAKVTKTPWGYSAKTIEEAYRRWVTNDVDHVDQPLAHPAGTTTSTSSDDLTKD